MTGCIVFPKRGIRTMHPIEKFHKMVAAGMVLGPEGTWISHGDAIKRKRWLFKHLFSGEVESNGKWIPITNLFGRKQQRTETLRLTTTTDEDVIHLTPPTTENTPIPDSTLNSLPDTALTRQESPPFIRQSTPPPPPETGVSSGQAAATVDRSPQETPEAFSPRQQKSISPAPEQQWPVPIPPDEISAQEADLPTRNEKNTPPASRPEETVVSRRPEPAQSVLPPAGSFTGSNGPVSPVGQSEKPERFSPQTEAAGFHAHERSSSAHGTGGNESPQRETITIRTIPLGKETTLTVSETRAGSAVVAICSIQGFIDQSNADDFNAQLASMLEFGVRYFIIDLEHTTLVGSAGWGVFAVTARLIKTAHGHFMICGMKDDIEESFLLLQFNEVIDSRKTISDCLDVIPQIIDETPASPADGENTPSVFSHYGESYEDLPLPEKIKTIIARNGPLSLFKIAAQLKTEPFGSISINPVRLYMLLKEMNLDTKMKQTRYYRSC